jgi:hypothetical protein
MSLFRDGDLSDLGMLVAGAFALGFLIVRMALP